MFRKLSIPEISKEDEPFRMYLYCYYGYLEELKKYSLEQLKNNIMEPGNLYLLAINSGHLNIIKYLETFPLTFNIYNKMKITNYTPYMLAVICGNIQIIKYLENRDCNIYSIDYVGNNALLLAIKKSQFKIFKIFLDNTKYSFGNKLNEIDHNAYLSAFSSDIKFLKYLDKFQGGIYGLNKSNYMYIKDTYFIWKIKNTIYIKRKNKYNALKTIILFI
jgi:hypothetical protein